jgi:uncharacterized protein (TIGR00730 family)
MPIRQLAVFCASTPGADPALVHAAAEVGRALADRGIGLVYGGGGGGLMGAVSQGVLDGGGEVVGVIPEFMVEREWGRHDLTELHVVASMHERKAMMADRADAFLALPGGLGTLEELFEVWTWRQIDLHRKPLGLLDIGGFWQPVVRALESLVAAGFVRGSSLADLVVETDLGRALDGLSALLDPDPDAEGLLDERS